MGIFLLPAHRIPPSTSPFLWGICLLVCLAFTKAGAVPSIRSVLSASVGLATGELTHLTIGEER